MNKDQAFLTICQKTILTKFDDEIIVNCFDIGLGDWKSNDLSTFPYANTYLTFIGTNLVIFLKIF